VNESTGTTLLPARPTTYNGVKMRSRLEARFAGNLDRLETRWEYEPRAFASGKDQYLPDFLVESGAAYRCYIEVKPFLGGAAEAIIERMAVISRSEPDAFLAVVTPTLGDFAIMARPGCEEPLSMGCWLWAVGGGACLAPLGFHAPRAAAAIEEGAGPVAIDWSWE
jgi:hypothetical protein